jgi:hypothetical protein
MRGKMRKVYKMLSPKILKEFLKFRTDDRSSKWGWWLRKYFINSRGQQMMGGPLAVWLDEGLAPLHLKKSASYETLQGTPVMDRSLGTT